jgi:predicted 2-oxoglutarate/Fe(II)-dependent dioxygenase YbiX
MDTLAPGIYTIPAFLGSEECKAHILSSEAAGYQTATINTRKGAAADLDVRNNSRVLVDDRILADSLWQRLRSNIPAFLDGRQAVGLNERFRFYRYASTERFVGHTDGAFERSNGEKSLLTFLVYLNEDFTGGETAFSDIVVRPRTGLALVFRHNLFHEGRPVESGVKYVLRSDVMFGPIGRLAG